MQMICEIVGVVGFVLMIIETLLINKSNKKTKIACGMAVAQFLIVLALFLWPVYPSDSWWTFLGAIAYSLFFLPVFGIWAVALIVISRKKDD